MIRLHRTLLLLLLVRLLLLLLLLLRVHRALWLRSRRRCRRRCLRLRCGSRRYLRPEHFIVLPLLQPGADLLRVLKHLARDAFDFKSIIRNPNSPLMCNIETLSVRGVPRSTGINHSETKVRCTLRDLIDIE